ncbi:hypothetical protein VPH35_041482 [Triticum aestivum]
MVKSEAENVMEAEVGGLVMVIGAYDIEELASSFGICSSGIHCFESGDYLQDENPRFTIGRRLRWCIVSFLEASLLENFDIRGPVARARKNPIGIDLSMFSLAANCERPPAPVRASSATCSDDDLSPLTSLPADLLELIGWRVLAGDLVDYIRFRAVCTHWRSSTVCPRGHGITDSRFHPRRWMMLPGGHGLHLGDGTKSFLNLSTGVFVRPRITLLEDHSVLCSVDGLLLMQRQHGEQEGPICLLHPFTGDAEKFPPITYHTVLRSGSTHFNSHNGCTYLLPGSVTASLSINTQGVAVITIVLRDMPRVLFATTKDKQWRLSSWSFSPNQSTISSQGKLYMLQPKPASTSELQIFQIDPHRPEKNSGFSPSLFPPPKVIAVCLKSMINSLFDFVESDSEILLVGSCDYMFYKRMVVYRIADLIQGRVVHLASIGGNALLVGLRSSGSGIGRNLCVSSKAMPTIAGDTIVRQVPTCAKYLEQYHIGTGTWSPTEEYLCSIRLQD